MLGLGWLVGIEGRKGGAGGAGAGAAGAGAGLLELGAGGAEAGAGGAGVVSCREEGQHHNTTVNKAGS